MFLARLAILPLLSVTCAFAQQEVVNRDTTLYLDHPQDAIVHMGGYLDGANTFTYPNIRAFQPMKKVTISNQGTKTVRHPRLVINSKRNWFDIDGIRSECFQGAYTVREKALALWKFMRNNSLHYYEPDYGREIDDAVKFLGVYGFGMCYNTSFVAASIASGMPYTGRAYMEYSPRNRHSVKDIKFDSTFILVDPDIEVFYLNRDNVSLSSYADIANDKYLISRVHHYGKAFEYNLFNDYIADAVYDPHAVEQYAGLYPEYHTLDFELRPGESVEYSWAPARYYHHYVDWTTNKAPMEDIGNGKLIYSTNFLTEDPYELINGFSGIGVFPGETGESHIHPLSANDTASFIVKVKSPFVIVNAEVTGNFYREGSGDRLAISFSRDSIRWEQVWTSSRTGVHADSIQLQDYIQPTTSAALYEFYIKVEMLSIKSAAACGVDSLSILTDFQVSRFFLPALQLGDNTISYSDKNVSGRNIAVKIEWDESYENIPPSRIEHPGFPADNGAVDSLQFTFQWEPAVDPDGITDYEFMLSDRADMRFPLLPSFELYTSSVGNQSGLNRFRIPFDGMLNANSIYYWKVRARDSKGAWGAWSPVWSFTPQGPMPPILAPAEVRADQILLSWSENKEGAPTLYYEVHASNEAFGFAPEASTLLDTTSTTTLSVPTRSSSPKSFYRIVAVDQFGSRSGPSNHEMIPYPHVYDNLDSVKAGEPYSLALTTNKVYTTDMLFLTTAFFPIEITDSVQVDIKFIPAWMSYDKRDKKMSGTPDYSETLSDSIVIEFKGVHTGFSNTQILRLPAMSNSKPKLHPIAHTASIDRSFDQMIFATDPDTPYGDYISKMEVVSKPSWLNTNYHENDGSMSIWGIPRIRNAGDTSITIRAYDSHNAWVEKSFPITVRFDEEFISDQPGIVMVAPNPFKRNVDIVYQLLHPGSVTVKIFDSKAQRVYTGPSERKDEAGVYVMKVDPNLQSNGMYYLIVEIHDSTGGTVSGKKIMKLE